MKPMKPRPPGSAFNAIVLMFAEIAGSVGAPITEGAGIAANRLGKSESLMRKYSDPDQPEQMNLPDAAILTSAFQVSSLAEFFALEAGGVFVPLPHPEGDSRWGALSAKAAEEFGEAMSEIIRSISAEGPGGARLTAAERRKLAAELDDVIRVFAEMRGQLRDPGERP